MVDDDCGRVRGSASVGARMLAAVARAEKASIDDLNPIGTFQQPVPGEVALYAALRPEHDAAAARVLDL